MFPLRDTIPSRSFPLVTIFIIFLNSIIFIYEVSLGDQVNELLRVFGVIPIYYTKAFQEDPFLLISGIPPLFTSLFLHGGWLHVISNMWFLWIFGDNVEDYTGHVRFLLFYLFSGIIATMAHVILNPFSIIPTIGASGAIAGVMGAYFILYPNSRVITLIFLFIFIQLIEIPAIIFLGLWILIQVISATMTTGVTQEGGGVAWWAHIGGFLSGLLTIFFFRKKR